MKVILNLPNNSSNLKDILKKKYNLKLTGLIKFLINNPDMLDLIDSKIDEYDNEYRFQKHMK